MVMQKNRDLSFDAFRELAIIAVVAIHAIYRLLTIGYYSFGIYYDTPRKPDQHIRW
jgi:fucose 4-O-acetylase-like acetyltransferase